MAVAALLVAVVLGALFACSAESAFILKPAAGPDEGLVSRWAFDEGEGDVAGDLSVNERDGSIRGTTWTTGPGSVWFRVDEIPTERGIVPIFYYGSRDSCANMFDASNQGLIIELGHSPVHYGSERLYFTIFANGCSYPSFCYDSGDPISEGEWHHFVAVVGESYNTGYLDGVEMLNRRYNFGSRTDSQFFEDAAKHEVLWIGKGFWDAEPVYFDGAIDDVRIYDHALSAEEVRQFYLSPRSM